MIMTKVLANRSVLQRVFPLLVLFISAIGCTLTGRAALEPAAPPLARAEPGMETPSPSSASPTIPPSTPLPSLTPSRTLLPPPTFEPPTPIPPPTEAPTVTPLPTLPVSTPILGLRGLETATPTATIACRPRNDWGGIHVVQPGEYLVAIAQRYQTTAEAIAEANCLPNMHLISVGQELKVPGFGPAGDGVECIAWEVLTPLNGSMSVPGVGLLTFNWRGPRAPRNLIRIHRPTGSTHEIVLELRQNETIDLSVIPEGGTFTWYVYPLDQNFAQVSCREGGPWSFTKEAAPN